MHDPRSLKYRIKVVGERVGKNREIKEGEPVKDHSGNVCDKKGGLEVIKSDKKRRYFEA